MASGPRAVSLSCFCDFCYQKNEKDFICNNFVNAFLFRGPCIRPANYGVELVEYIWLPNKRAIDNVPDFGNG